MPNPDPSRNGKATQFKPGNGKGGNVWAGHVAKLRKAFFASIRTGDIKEIVANLIFMAKGQNKLSIQAARIVLDLANIKPPEDTTLSIGTGNQQITLQLAVKEEPKKDDPPKICKEII